MCTKQWKVVLHERERERENRIWIRVHVIISSSSTSSRVSSRVASLTTELTFISLLRLLILHIHDSERASVYPQILRRGSRFVVVPTIHRMVYVRQKSLHGLKEYKYAGVDHSLLSRYILKPFYNNVAIKCFPMSMAWVLICFAIMDEADCSFALKPKCCMQVSREPSPYLLILKTFRLHSLALVLSC